MTKPTNPETPKAEHTPTPWAFDRKELTIYKDGQIIADCNVETFIDKARIDGAFIVRAVNAYDRDQEIKRELLEALEEGEDIISGLEADADRAGIDLAEARHWWANVAGAAIKNAREDTTLVCFQCDQGVAKTEWSKKDGLCIYCVKLNKKADKTNEK